MYQKLNHQISPTMKEKLPTERRMNDLLTKETLLPLVKMLLESDNIPDCEKLRDALTFFSLINQSIMRDNSSYVCFTNLKTMYQHDDIPVNVFWISAVNSVYSGVPIPQNLLIEDLGKIIENTTSKGFSLSHEWYFEDGGNSGVFLHFTKDKPMDHDFVSILIAY